MTTRNSPERPFVERWAAKERVLGFDQLGTTFTKCSNSTLPSDAAPCLTFKYAESMPAIWEVFGPADKWSANDKKRLEPYRLIGFDGCGNPICVEPASGEICLLDHEDNFHTRQFVNSGVSQLGESLLAYMGEQDADTFRKAIGVLDPPAIHKGSFWYHEAACVGENID